MKSYQRRTGRSNHSAFLRMTFWVPVRLTKSYGQVFNSILVGPGMSLTSWSTELIRITMKWTIFHPNRLSILKFISFLRIERRFWVSACFGLRVTYFSVFGLILWFYSAFMLLSLSLPYCFGELFLCVQYYTPRCSRDSILFAELRESRQTGQ